MKKPGGRKIKPPGAVTSSAHKEAPEGTARLDGKKLSSRAQRLTPASLRFQRDPILSCISGRGISPRCSLRRGSQIRIHCLDRRRSGRYIVRIRTDAAV
jgi:hypothetical protein